MPPGKDCTADSLVLQLVSTAHIGARCQPNTSKDLSDYTAARYQFNNFIWPVLKEIQKSPFLRREEA